MTTTTPAPDSARIERPGRAGGGAAGPAQIAPPPKMRRRPAMVALSVALICVGGLASAWAWQSTSNAQEVLTVRETVHRGEVIEEADLVAVQIGLDPAIQAVPAADLSTLVGKRAALDIAAGGVVTADQVTDAMVPPKGYAVVGLSLTAAMLPTDQIIVPGDLVRVVTTAGEAGAAVEPGTEIPTYAASVVGVSIDEITGNTLVNVQVARPKAAIVGALAANGQVALVLDSQEQ
ncbi:SAF domain-containing protein [Promicromonospora umidemergens]|uniref:AFP-like domain-containing protein n=1 Tax=Promicromonospora umidemergens TaxID=629679 RepID=A0ABP8Y2D2_9MICO|nr:SAF domain-containing protein [Promicromonospora umidemergens]MCP2284557.1 SAF domain-containing protein [Promicromonospora umidemergens]